jgi:hypothetical protein
MSEIIAIYLGWATALVVLGVGGCVATYVLGVACDWIDGRPRRFTAAEIRAAVARSRRGEE